MHYPQILPLVELFFDFHPPAVRPDGSIHFACAKHSQALRKASPGMAGRTVVGGYVYLENLKRCG